MIWTRETTARGVHRERRQKIVPGDVKLLAEMEKEHDLLTP